MRFRLSTLPIGFRGNAFPLVERVIPAGIAEIQTPWKARNLPTMALDTHFGRADEFLHLAEIA
jgi:hypothetical protein